MSEPIPRDVYPHSAEDYLLGHADWETLPSSEQARVIDYREQAISPDAAYLEQVQVEFEAEVFAKHRARILEIFGVTQDDLDQLERDTGYQAAKAQWEADNAEFLAWAKGVQPGDLFTHKDPG